MVFCGGVGLDVGVEFVVGVVGFFDGFVYVGDWVD